MQRVKGVEFEGWPDPARALVQSAIDAHGGLERWRATTSIQLAFESAAGWLFTLKGYQRTFVAPRGYEIRPHERTTIFHGYPDAGHRGWFVDGDVRIERVSDGVVIGEGRRHRESFRGLAKYRRWSNLDALYFFGYALWHYHVVPFTLGQARFVRFVSHRGIEVEFAPDVHTHCRRQTFFFDAGGRIVRHDYVAEVIGRWASGCHFWRDYRDAGGLPVACRRRVTGRLFGAPVPLTVLDVRLRPSERQ